MFHFKKNEIPFWFPNQCVHPIIETISFTILFCGPFDAEQHRPYQLFTLSLICCNMLSWLVVSFALKVPIQPQSYSLPYDITSNDHFLICLGLVFDPFYFFFFKYITSISHFRVVTSDDDPRKTSSFWDGLSVTPEAGHALPICRQALRRGAGYWYGAAAAHRTAKLGLVGQCENGSKHI